MFGVFQPIMALLPSPRISQIIPFVLIVMDIAGSLNITLKQSRGVNIDTYVELNTVLIQIEVV